MSRVNMSPKKMIDLRSDTVTQPTAAMRAAMAAAPVGDDVFGDDPTINALQERIAHMLGKEAALFMPTGTQSNLCGLMAHCERGDEFLVGQMAHTYRWEGGGAAVLGSIQPQPLLQQSDGSIALSDIEANIKPDDAHFARTRLLALENTWGGKVLPMDYIQAATALARSKGLACHLDGARLFNAAVAQAKRLGSKPEVQVLEIAKPFDSVSVCFSKGLGTPVGSALVGSKALIAKAHRIRKMLGGACGKWASWERRRCMRWTTTLIGSMKTIAWPRDWPKACKDLRVSASRCRKPIWSLWTLSLARPTEPSSDCARRASCARGCTVCAW